MTNTHVITRRAVRGRAFRLPGVLLASVLLATAGIAAASAQTVSSALALKAPDAASMIAAATDKGTVRVIVEFASQITPGPVQATPDAIAAAQTEVSAAQDAILVDQFGSATALPPELGLKRMLISPMFAANVTLQQLESLASDPRITHIYSDEPQPLLLSDTVPLIGMPNAYADGGDGSGQVVAVIDTGVQGDHLFLGGRVVAEHCYSTTNSADGTVTLCPNGTMDQDGPGSADPRSAPCYNGIGLTNICDHGTHVAGIAAGSHTGGGPTSGVARASQIVAVQVFSRENNAGSCFGEPAPCVISYPDDQLSALNWLFANALTLPGGVKLAAINMSLGGGAYSSSCDSDPLKSIIDNLRNAGVATIIAAGNDGYRNSIGAPACISSAIAVAASDKNDLVASYTDIDSQVALFAPGGFGYDAGYTSPSQNVYSSVSNPAGAVAGFGYKAGTSMAAPHVAGAFASIRSACPSIPYTSAGVDLILSALEQAGKTVTDTRSGGSISKPRIQVDAAITIACNKVANTPTCSLTVSPSTASVNQELAVSWVSTNATSGSIDHGIGSVSPVSGGVFKGSFSSVDTFVLTGTFSGLGGTTTCQDSVIVQAVVTGDLDPLTLLGLVGLAGIGIGGRALRRRA